MISRILESVAPEFGVMKFSILPIGHGEATGPLVRKLSRKFRSL